jgi:hypothetical protein
MLAAHLRRCDIESNRDDAVGQYVPRGRTTSVIVDIVLCCARCCRGSFLMNSGVPELWAVEIGLGTCLIGQRDLTPMNAP